MPSPPPTGPVPAGPIHLVSAFPSAGTPAPDSHHYTRISNPTWEALEAELGRREEARALAFASGQAATHALLLALTEGGRRRAILPADGYYEARTLVGMHPERATLEVADHADLPAVREALAGGGALLWSESPSNPLLRVVDLTALAELAGEASAPFVVDNTTATSVLQRPLDLGATAVLTSLSKATSGHGDVVLGAVTTRDEELHGRLVRWRQVGGAIPGPFEAWAAHRGLATLDLRVARQCASALAIAEHLFRDARVRRVHYPGLPGPRRDLALRQMSGGFGPLLSFELDGDAAAADRVVAASRRVRPATSFGGVESSWERRARWASETAPPALIRLSVGVEPLADLLEDLDRALAAVAGN